MMPAAISPQPGVARRRPARCRMPAEVRIAEILDAALALFAERGYANTRIDDIALRAGLSKGGVYNHFDSKDAIFEGLMRRALTPPADEQPDAEVLANPRALAAWVVDRIHSVITRPTSIAVFRLIVAEGDRVPHLLQMWQREIADPGHRTLSETLRLTSYAQNSLAARLPWLVVSPAVYLLVQRTLHGELAPLTLAEHREAHIELLCAMMATPAPADSSMPPQAN